MKEHKDFEVTIPVRETWQERSLPHRVFKIFGDFGSMTYTIKERPFHLDLAKNQEIKNALQRILARDIIVVGTDRVWDEGIIRAIPPKSGSIFFINEEDFDENSIQHSFFNKREVQYIRASYDYFMRGLYSYLDV